MTIVGVEGTIQNRALAPGDLTGKKVLRRTSDKIFVGDPKQAGKHNELASIQAGMYLVGEILVISTTEWNSL